MKVCSWNVNGIRSVLSKGALADYVKQEQPDMLLLQEVRALEEQIREAIALPVFSNYLMFFHPAEKKGYSGVVVWTHKKHGTPERVQRGIPGFTDTEGRAIGIFLPDRTVYFSLYIPNGGKSDEAFEHKRAFLRALADYVKTLHKEKYTLVLGGDFNIAHSAVDLAQPEKHEGGTHFSEKMTAHLDALTSAGLFDSFRTLHPDAKERYTYWDNFDFSLPRGTRPRAVNRGWRLDYIYVSETMLQKTVVADIHSTALGSDHCPIVYEYK